MGLRSIFAATAALTVFTATAGVVSGAAAVTPPSTLSPLGLACAVQADGVRFCAGNGTTTRIASWDGTPLDTDVTLPPTGDGPFPTIVMLHGWGNDKTGFESTDLIGHGYNAGAGVYGPVTYHYNNDFYARRGYAVVTYSARGKGASCGGGGLPLAQLQTGPCADGFIRLADQRYEIRDTQYLLGRLVDEKITQPGAIGVTGISYGGGQSLELAYLKDRIVCSGGTVAGDPCTGHGDGDFLPWTSPLGTPLSIAAAHPRWFWSDLVSALMPNGRFLDSDPSTASTRSPVGVEIESFLNGLVATGTKGGYIVAPQLPGSPKSAWDITAFAAILNAGEPYGAAAQTVLDEIVAHHQGFGITGSTPAPLLLESGWTDELFPPAESLRVYNDLRRRNPAAPVSLLFGDVGHSHGSNKQAVNSTFNDQTAAFFAAHLQGLGQGPAAGSVTAMTTTCPATEPDGGPYVAPSWNALHPGTVSFGTAAAQTVTSAGNPALSVQFDPIANSDSCKTVPVEVDPGTAVYTCASSGFTLLGLPTITTTIATTGTGGQLDGRLWDVSPDGRQLFVTRGTYRLLDNQRGTITFQLHGNGYRFAAGHTAKVELLGSDSAYYRASNTPFSVTVTDTRIALPTAESS